MGSKRYIIGLGSGRCGTHSLAALLNKQHNTHISHELRPYLPWKKDLSKFKAHTARYDSDTSTFVGEVAFFLMPYVLDILKLYNNVKFICLRRDRAATVKSYLNRNKNCQWTLHNGVRGYWYWCYPKFAYCTTEEAIGLYWDLYYSAAESWQERLSRDVFRVYDIDALNNLDMVSEILKFAGIPNPKPIVMKLSVTYGHTTTAS